MYAPFTNNCTEQIIDDIRKSLQYINKSQITIDTNDICHLLGRIDTLYSIISDYTRIYEEIENELNEYRKIVKNIENDCNTSIYSIKKKLNEEKHIIFKDGRCTNRNRYQIVRLQAYKTKCEEILKIIRGEK